MDGACAAVVDVRWQLPLVVRWRYWCLEVSVAACCLCALVAPVGAKVVVLGWGMCWCCRCALVASVGGAVAVLVLGSG